jgi:lysophospholipase L1-like esterase
MRADTYLTARRWLAAALGLVLIAVVGGTLLRNWNRPQEPCRAHGSIPVTSGSPTAVVIGDSYSAGVLLPNPREAWPTILAREEHWKAYVEGVSTTGVTTDGFCPNQNFLHRLPKALAHHPQILIMQTGLNDATSPPGAVRAKTTELLEKASKVPQLVVVGPPPAPATPPARLRRVDAELREACRPPRCHYVSALRWQLPYAPDRLHLTAAGHLIFGTEVAEALRAARVGNPAQP